MVGTTGRVIGAIGPGLVGEVMIAVRGGSEAFYAYPSLPDEHIPIGAQVQVVDFVAPRSVYVTRLY